MDLPHLLDQQVRESQAKRFPLRLSLELLPAIKGPTAVGEIHPRNEMQHSRAQVRTELHSPLLLVGHVVHRPSHSHIEFPRCADLFSLSLTKSQETIDCP
jgi:hypothetical protein